MANFSGFPSEGLHLTTELRELVMEPGQLQEPSRCRTRCRCHHRRARVRLPMPVGPSKPGAIGCWFRCVECGRVRRRFGTAAPRSIPYDRGVRALLAIGWLAAASAAHADVAAGKVVSP